MSYYISHNHTGEYIDYKPENGKNFKLQELYKKIGCKLIEVVSLNDGWIMIIDEEGKLNDKPVNNIGTAYLRQTRHTQDYIVGDIVLCPSEMLE